MVAIGDAGIMVAQGKQIRSCQMSQKALPDVFCGLPPRDLVPTEGGCSRCTEYRLEVGADMTLVHRTRS